MSDDTSTLSDQFLKAQEDDSWWDRFMRKAGNSLSRSGGLFTPLKPVGWALSSVKVPSDAMRQRDTAEQVTADVLANRRTQALTAGDLTGNRQAEQNLNTQGLTDYAALAEGNPGLSDTDMEALSQHLGRPAPQVGGKPWRPVAPPKIINTARGGTSTIIDPNQGTTINTIEGQPVLPTPHGTPGLEGQIEARRQFYIGLGMQPQQANRRAEHDVIQATRKSSKLPHRAASTAFPTFAAARQQQIKDGTTATHQITQEREGFYLRPKPPALAGMEGDGGVDELLGKTGGTGGGAEPNADAILSRASELMDQQGLGEEEALAQARHEMAR